jgi:hypothetical protein
MYMAIEFKEVQISSKTLLEALNKNKPNEIVLITSDNKCLLINGTAKIFQGITAQQARKLV